MLIRPEKALEDEESGVDKVINLLEATNYREPVRGLGLKRL